MELQRQQLSCFSLWCIRKSNIWDLTASLQTASFKSFYQLFMRRLNCFYCRANRYTCVIFVYSLWMGNLEATLIPLYYTILILLSHLGGSTWQKCRIRPICVWGCQAYSLGQVASNSDYLVFEANFMEGPAHTEPENRLLLLCSTQRHQTWKHKTEDTCHHGSVDATRSWCFSTSYHKYIFVHIFKLFV